MNRFVAFFLLGLFLFVPVTNVSGEEQKFGGVGLQVVPTITGELVVLNVLEETPAAEKGVLPGDLIFQVDDFPELMKAYFIYSRLGCVRDRLDG